MDFFRQLFVWWRGQTLGTRLWTIFRGKKIGTDEVGNVYYRHRQLENRRWVIYEGIVDASKIPPEWHAWLHNMVRNPPRADADEDARSWFRPHVPNFTGTDKAYLRKPATGGDGGPKASEYEAWTPNSDSQSGGK